MGEHRLRAFENRMIMRIFEAKLGRTNVDERTVSKWSLKKLNTRIWTGFV
jgi:hypothetical protein